MNTSHIKSYAPKARTAFIDAVSKQAESYGISAKGCLNAEVKVTGLGGLGFFATIKGINHASEKYENGGDAVEAIFEGTGVAIEGTARALVGAAEMGYNVLASRPSRIIGRSVLKGLIKLDEKMMESGKPK